MILLTVWVRLKSPNPRKGIETQDHATALREAGVGLKSPNPRKGIETQRSVLFRQ